MSEMENIKEQIIKNFSPQAILLFGSRSKGTAKSNSDIDLCIVAPTADKRRLLTDMYCQIEADTPIDLLLYTPAEWEEFLQDRQSFAHKINRDGLWLYG